MSTLSANPVATGEIGVVRAVCVVENLIEDDGVRGVSAIDKRAVQGPVKADRLGLRGDVQADREHHGGPDRALYAYSAAEAFHWSMVLGKPYAPGFFGENLLIGGPVDDLEIGQQIRIGEVLAEVTGPRSPCMTFERRVGVAGWVKKFSARNRVGIYLRVIENGSIEAGQRVSSEYVPGHEITCHRWWAHRDKADARTLLKYEQRGRLEIADYLRRRVVSAAGYREG